MVPYIVGYQIASVFSSIAWSLVFTKEPWLCHWNWWNTGCYIFAVEKNSIKLLSTLLPLWI